MNQLSQIVASFIRYPDSGMSLTRIIATDGSDFGVLDSPETEWFGRTIDVTHSYDAGAGQRGMINKRFRTREEAMNWIETQLPF